LTSVFRLFFMLAISWIFLSILVVWIFQSSFLRFPPKTIIGHGTLVAFSSFKSQVSCAAFKPSKMSNGTVLSATLFLYNIRLKQMSLSVLMYTIKSG
jgi:hypothetical protein